MFRCKYCILDMDAYMVRNELEAIAVTETSLTFAY